MAAGPLSTQQNLCCQSAWHSLLKVPHHLPTLLPPGSPESTQVGGQRCQTLERDPAHLTPRQASWADRESTPHRQGPNLSGTCQGPLTRLPFGPGSPTGPGNP